MRLIDYMQSPDFIKRKWYDSIVMQVGLRYFGGKAVIGKKLLNIIFEMQAKLFAEGKQADIFIDAFTGGGKIGLTIPDGWFKTIVMNDLNKGVYNFYHYCKTEPDKLVKMIEILGKVMSYEMFRFCAENRNSETVEPLVSAAMTYWVTAGSWLGETDPKTVQYSLNTGDKNETEEIHKAIRTAQKRIPQIHVQMRRQNIIIENMDYRELIKKYKSLSEKNEQRIIWYFDPPYHAVTLNAGKPAPYEDSFPIKMTTEMTNIIKNMQYYVKSDYDPKEVLEKDHANYGDFDVLEDESTGHFKMLVGVFDKGTTDSTGEKTKGKEFVWCRYDGEHILKYNEQLKSYEWILV